MILPMCVKESHIKNLGDVLSFLSMPQCHNITSLESTEEQISLSNGISLVINWDYEVHG